MPPVVNSDWRRGEMVREKDGAEEGKNEGERLFGKVHMRLYRRKMMPLEDLVRQANRPIEVGRL